MLGTCVSALSARITYLARRPTRDSGEAAILRQAVASCGTRGTPALVSPGAKHEVQTPLWMGGSLWNTSNGRSMHKCSCKSVYFMWKGEGKIVLIE